jgi:hypothetical protein
MISRALHLNIFEQPVYIDFFNRLLGDILADRARKVKGFVRLHRKEVPVKIPLNPPLKKGEAKKPSPFVKGS